MGILQGVKHYYELFGFPGLLTVASYCLFGAPSQIIGHPAGITHPVQLRVRTTDISLYHDLLITRAYDLELPRAPRTIVDAGANVGLATIFFANKYPDAKIFAVEPEPSNFACLCENVKHYKNVVTIEAALWCEDCGVFLNLPQNSSAAFNKWGFQVQDAGIPARGITIATLMREAGLRSIDLLKMDIEGGEIEAFADSEWVSRVEAIAVELHDRIRPGCKAAVDKAVKGFRSSQKGELTVYLRADPIAA